MRIPARSPRTTLPMRMVLLLLLVLWAGWGLVVADWLPSGIPGMHALEATAARIAAALRKRDRSMALERVRNGQRQPRHLSISASHGWPARAGRARIVTCSVRFNRYAEGIYSTSLEPELASLQHVALLVDYPVLLRAIRATDPDAVPRLGDIVRRARALGSVLVSRAFGAWYDVDEATTAFSEGLDPVYVPPAGPGNVPTTTALITDGLAVLQAGQIQALALSGDDRLLPLMVAAHEAGVPVALIAHACQPDGPCVKLATSAEPAAVFARTMSRAERYRRPTSAA